jgi:hypothetical protein
VQRRLVRRIAQQPLAKLSDGHARNRRESGCVVGVDNKAGHLVLLVGDQRLGEELA